MGPPVTRREFGESQDVTLKMRWCYAMALYDDADASLDDLRESVTTLEDMERTVRRVPGGAHPTTTGIERRRQESRAGLRALETPPPSESV